MSDLPKTVHLHEDGPREGFQSEPRYIPAADKVRLIEALSETGLDEICCTSYVNPKMLPQMADAEEVAHLLKRKPGVHYYGLWLNEQGFKRALSGGLDLSPNLLGIVSNSMALRNNGCTAEELIQVQGRLADRYREAGLALDMLQVSTAFGCYFEGDVAPEDTVATLDKLMGVCAESGLSPKTVYLCDTVGAATPESVKRLVGMVREKWPEHTFGLHLHDTRGFGLANVYAGLQMGIARFDTSIAGLGGCPFAGNKSAAGNVCTEDVALMCEEMGIETGLDFEALQRCALLAEEIVGHPLPGKSMKAGRIAAHAAH